MKKHSLCDTIILVGICLVLMFSPLAFGAVHVWAYTIVELVVFALLGLWCLDRWVLHRKPFQWVKTPLNGFALLIMVLVLAQIAPMPEEVADFLSPKEAADQIQARDLTALARGESPDSGRWLSLSYSPHMSRVQGLKLATVFGVFFLVVNTVRSRMRINLLVYLLIFTGLFEALYGIAQYFGHSAGILWLNKWSGRSTGTFLGANHFAFYMEMMFCLCVGVFLAFRRRVRRPATDSRMPRSRIRQWVAMFSPESTRPRRLLFLLVSVILGLALLSSGSRGGLIAATLGMLFAAALLYCKKGRSAIPIFIVTVAVLGSGLYLRTDCTLERFDHPESSYGRIEVARSVVPMIKDYPIAGVGLGNFRFLYPRYVPGKTDRVASTGHAHNDWIEAVAELGLAGGGLIVGAFFFYLYRMLCIWRQRNDLHAVGIGIGVLAAVIATGFHSFFDFSLYYPANSLTLAAILALGWIAVHRRGTGYSESFFYGVRTFSPTRLQRLGLFAAALLIIGAGMSLSARHGMAEAHCPSEWNSTLNLDLKPDADKIRAAISYNSHNADYYFKQAMEMLDYRMEFQSVAPNKQLRIIDDLTRAVGLNPAKSLYWSVLAKRLVAKSYDGYGYVTRWLPLADQCLDVAVKCAPKDRKLLFRAGAHWLWRSAMLPADPTEDTGENNVMTRQAAVAKFRSFFRRSLAISARQWKKAAELVWMYYPEDAMIYALAPDDNPGLKRKMLQWVAGK